MAQPGGGALRANSPLRRARAQRVVELLLNNVPLKDIGMMLGGLNEKTIRRERTWAEQHGVVEEVTKRFTDKLLNKAANIYEKTLDLEANEANVALVKVHDLKLKAARDIVQGTGVLSKDKGAKVPKDAVPSLEGYVEIYKAKMQLRAASPPVPESPAPALPTTEIIEADSHEPLRDV